MHTILSDSEAMRWWSTAPHAAVEETRAWLDMMMATAPPNGENFIVEHGGRVIGKARFYRFPKRAC